MFVNGTAMKRPNGLHDLYWHCVMPAEQTKDV